MVSLTLNELRLIAGKRIIKNYKNVSREKLWSTFDESERNFQNLSQNVLEQIKKKAESFTKWVRGNNKNT